MLAQPIILVSISLVVSLYSPSINSMGKQGQLKIKRPFYVSIIILLYPDDNDNDRTYVTSHLG